MYEEIAKTPCGEDIVSMVSHDETLFVATARTIYILVEHESGYELQEIPRNN